MANEGKFVGFWYNDEALGTSKWLKKIYWFSLTMNSLIYYSVSFNGWSHHLDPTQAEDRFYWGYKARRGNLFPIYSTPPTVTHCMETSRTSPDSSDVDTLVLTIVIGRVVFRKSWTIYGYTSASSEMSLTYILGSTILSGISDVASLISILGLEACSSWHYIMHEAFAWLSGIRSTSFSRVL